MLNIFGTQDQHILGSRKTFGYSVSKDRERADSQRWYGDPKFLGSHWNLEADYRVPISL